MTTMTKTPYEIKIAASIIAGDTCTKQDWQRMEKSLVGQVDFIALSWNGKKNKPPAWMSAGKAVPVGYVHSPWRKDFSEQRNVAHELAVRMGADWILWVDTDDEVKGNTRLAIAGLDENTTGIFCRYDYGIDPETGIVVVEQWRERLLSVETNWKWRYRIHEVCLAPPGTQMASRDQLWNVHHRQPGHDKRTRDRNRELLKLAMDDTPDPRFLMYMANESYAEAFEEGKTDTEMHALFASAISMYRQFVAQRPGTDDGYLAQHRVADIHRELGKYNEAIDIDLQCVKLRASWPDAYNGIASSCIALGDPSSACEWATLGMTVAANKPTTTQVIESLESTYIPYLNRGTARDMMGDTKGALEDLSHALTAYPTEALEEQVEELRKQLALPRPTVEAPDTLLNTCRNTKPERSIAFFARQTFEPWHPKYEAVRGMGGAETCIMRLATRFAADGWRVAVFGNPGEHEGIDEHGVEWWKHEEFIANDRYTVVVGSRAPELFDANLNAEAKILWMHDVNARAELMPDAGFGDRTSRMDAIFCLTSWHAAHTRRLYDIKCPVHVMPNGFEAQNFARIPETRSAPKFVYASSPDRGLDVVLGMWDKVRDKWPDATLDVFYGWASIDAILRVHASSPMGRWLQQFKDSINAAIENLGGEKGGIFWRDRMPQAQLANELYKFTAWLYPTFFMETFCITALEMQAAGVIPVTSNLAALRETVFVDELRVEGWPNNMSFRDEWLDKLDLVMQVAEAAGPRYRKWQMDARKHALGYDWDNVYKWWITELQHTTKRGLLAA